MDAVELDAQAVPLPPRAAQWSEEAEVGVGVGAVARLVYELRWLKAEALRRPSEWDAAQLQQALRRRLSERGIGRETPDPRPEEWREEWRPLLQPLYTGWGGRGVRRARELRWLKEAIEPTHHYDQGLRPWDVDVATATAFVDGFLPSLLAEGEALGDKALRRLKKRLRPTFEFEPPAELRGRITFELETKWLQRRFGERAVAECEGELRETFRQLTGAAGGGADKRPRLARFTSDGEWMRLRCKCQMMCDRARIFSGNEKHGRKWRQTLANSNYSLSDTYPTRLWVPGKTSDAQLRKVAKQRSKGLIEPNPPPPPPAPPASGLAPACDRPAAPL